MDFLHICDNAFTESSLSEQLKDGIMPKHAFSWAAEHGFTNLVTKMIDMGANLRENDNYPLELASKFGHTDIVKLLLDKGVRTSDGTDEGYALRLSAYKGHVDIVKMLLEAGADPTADNYHALKIASDKQIIEMIIDAAYGVRHPKQ